MVHSFLGSFLEPLGHVNPYFPAVSAIAIHYTSLAFDGRDSEANQETNYVHLDCLFDRL